MDATFEDQDIQNTKENSGFLQKADVFDEIQRASSDIEKEIHFKIDKEMTQRQEYLNSIVGVIDGKFKDQNNQLKNQVLNVKNELDKLVSKFDDQNSELRDKQVDQQNKIHDQVKSDWEQFKIKNIEDFNAKMLKYQEHYEKINNFIFDNQIQNDPIKLDIGGTQMAVGRQTLTYVPGSKLADMFEGNLKLKYVDKDKVFLDRNPEPFAHMIDFLRNERKILPKNVSDDMKKMIEQEIAYWALYADMGLKDYNYLSLTKQAMEVEQLLVSTPNLDPEEYQVSIETWKKLGPITVDEILENTNVQPDFNNLQIDFLVVEFDTLVKYGQIKKITDSKEGICRVEYNNDGTIQEGQFFNNKMNGYGRIIRQDGEFYVGMFKDNRKNGKGKNVLANGAIEQGHFKQGEYIGQIAEVV